MPWYYILLIVLLSLFLIFLIIEIFIAYYTVMLVIVPKCAPLEKVLANEIKLNKLKDGELESLNLQPFDIKSKYGYTLKGYYIASNKKVEFKDKKERVVILVHGWTARHETMLAYGKIFLDLGFHVFCYDHRNHGDSDKKYTTMGDKEADDLQTLVELVYEKMGHNIVIGTMGESMGSATSMIHAGRYHSIDFMVEDCGYSSLKDLLKYLCKKTMHLPVFPTIFLANIIYKLKTGSSFNKCEVSNYVASCDDIPMCFNHGDADDFVPSYMVYKCYDVKPGFKHINLLKCDVHAHCIVNYPYEYAKNVKKFLIESKIIDAND